MISKETAIDIALAHREIEVARELLNEIKKAEDRREVPDVRDAFGRRHGGLEMGIPSGQSSRRLFNVPWSLAKVVIETHIVAQEQVIKALNVKAAIEVAGEDPDFAEVQA